MKIGLVFNMANNQYLIAKALRKAGVDAELIINGRDFGMGMPHWEESVIVGIDPYETNADQMAAHYDLPPWVRVWNPGDLHVSPHKIIALMRMAREYDLIQLSPPSVIYLQFAGVPFIVHESGWLRHLPYKNGAAEKLARRGYAKAECIVMTNADCYPHLERIHYRKQVFIPFVIETDRYRPMAQPNNDVLTFFHPARHVWDVKGNDRLLYAFAQFIKKGYGGKLIMIDWGVLEDSRGSLELVKKLGIENSVQWLPPASKPTLIQLYNLSDAVFDQFLLGCYGTTAPEAMACGKPVVMRLERACNEQCYGEFPPVLNASTVSEIFEAMVALTDPTLRRKYGEAGRQYVLKHHAPAKIASQYVRVYDEVLG